MADIFGVVFVLALLTGAGCLVGSGFRAAQHCSAVTGHTEYRIADDGRIVCQVLSDATPEGR